MGKSWIVFGDILVLESFWRHFGDILETFWYLDGFWRHFGEFLDTFWKSAIPQLDTSTFGFGFGSVYLVTSEFPAHILF